MKKVILTTAIAVAALSSCKKQDGFVSKKDSVDSASLVFTKIEQLRTQVASQATSTKTPKPLGTIQTAVGYAAADGTGAVKTYEYTSWLVGPGYGAAFGLLGGIGASLWLYCGKHYDFLVINGPTGVDGTSTFTNQYEQIGYMHNQELIKTFANGDFVKPASLNDLINGQYMSMYYTDVSSQLNLNYNTFVQNSPKSQIAFGINDIINATSTADYAAVMTNAGVDAAVVNMYASFLNDANNPNLDSKTVYSFCDLYIQYVNQSTGLNAIQKYQLLDGINVFKYSYALWSNNTL